MQAHQKGLNTKLMGSLKRYLLFLTSLLLMTFQGLAGESRRQATIAEIEKVLRTASTAILAEQKPGGYWLYPSSIGMMYVSQYYLMSHWLGVQPQSALQADELKQHILASQLPDGSWETLRDVNLPKGDINPTIYHYWALKVMGVPINDPVMAKARAYILRAGGLDKASQFTRVFLSLFGNLSWEDFPAIPYLLFDAWAPVNENQFAQWVGSHLIAIAYLQKNHVYKNLGPRFKLEELRLKSTRGSKVVAPHSPTSADEQLIRIMLNKQQRYGSFGGYTPATQLSMAVIDHFSRHRNLAPEFRRRLQAAKVEGFKFIEELLVKNPDGAYKGVACDGRYWDTALVGQGLIEAGVPAEQLRPTAKYLAKIQNAKSGGYGFGYDFENYEDTDDTAEILLFFKKAGFQSAKHQLAIAWLMRMQNDDGGWGAFAKNNDGNLFLEQMTKDFLDSADLFDESSADVTGHILEALAAYGYHINNSPQVRAAVEYLRKQQLRSFGGWEGRWGVNYIYGTSAAVIGLVKAGVAAHDPMIQKALDWLESCSNRVDGGFGESFLSYSYDDFKCGGRSTASQTAWAMMALIEGGRTQSPVVAAAATYLTRMYDSQGRWIDASFVGTGHPKIVPMEYPAYPKSFTLMALGRYLKEIQAR